MARPGINTLLTVILSGWLSGLPRLRHAAAHMLILGLLLGSPCSVLYYAVTPFSEQEEDPETTSKLELTIGSDSSAERSLDRRTRFGRRSPEIQHLHPGRSTAQATQVLSLPTVFSTLIGAGIRVRC